MLEAGHILQERYEVVQHIGAGGMAHVYLAHDRRLGGRSVALKEMDPARLSSMDVAWARDAFLQEAQVLARLSHPGIARVTDFFEHDGLLYLVMEYVEGETLEEALKRTPQGFAESQTLMWAGQLISMLDYLHGQNPPIIFRDLKPGNIMVRPDGSLKLIDFGIARYFKPGQLLDTVRLGTPGYAAPEAYGQGQTTARSDVYSLGVLLHQILTGYDPTASPLVLPPAEQLTPAVSSHVALAISRATATEPELRHANVQQFANALGIGGEPPSPPLLPPTEILGDDEVRRPRPKLLWAGLGVLALLLVVGLGWALGARNGNGKGGAPIAPQIAVVVDGDEREGLETEGREGPAETANADEPGEPPAGTPVPEEQGEQALAALVGEATEATETATATPTPSPSPSPEPSPTPTLLPTPTFLPTATWTPLPQPTPCALAVSSGFSSRYVSNLGCPLNNVHTTNTALENFERGYMIWREDTDEIYAIYHGGSWNRFGDLFAETMPGYSCGVEESPPTPVRGFGMIWCRHDYVRQGLGNATNAEWGSSSSAQEFANGTIIQTDMGTFVLLYNGSWR